MKNVFKFGCLGIIAVVVIIIIIAVVAVGGGDDTDKSSKDSTGSKAKSEEVVTTGIGQPLTVGDVTFTVNSTSTGTNVGGEYGQTAKGKYLLVNVTVQNGGSESITVDSSFFKLKAGDKEYNSDSTAGIYANEDSEFFLEQLNPDLSLSGTVVFDVTDEVIANPGLLLNVQTGIFGTEQGQIKISK